MNCSYTIDDCQLINLPTFSDERGILTALEKELSFDVRRIFWLYGINEGMGRGAHALLEGEEIMVAVHGSFVVDLDDGANKTSVLLDSPSKGLIIKPGIWFATREYKQDGVSLIIANEEYSRDRYTYDYDEYILLRITTYQNK